MFLFSSLTNKDCITHKLYNALTTQYSENGSGYPVLEPVLELYNRFLGTGSYVKSLVIIVMSRVLITVTHSVSAVFCPFFYNLPRVKHHCELLVPECIQQ